MDVFAVDPSSLPRMIGRIASTAFDVLSGLSIGGELSDPKVTEEWCRVFPLEFASVVYIPLTFFEGKIARVLVTTIETVEITVLTPSNEDRTGR